MKSNQSTRRGIVLENLVVQARSLRIAHYFSTACHLFAGEQARSAVGEMPDANLVANGLRSQVDAILIQWINGQLESTQARRMLTTLRQSVSAGSVEEQDMRAACCSVVDAAKRAIHASDVAESQALNQSKERPTLRVFSPQIA